MNQIMKNSTKFCLRSLHFKGMKRFGIGLVILLLSTHLPLAHAKSSKTAKTCAVVEKFGRAAQVIPKSGPVITRFESQTPLECGSMVITHSDGFWFKVSNQVLVRLAPNSFYEIGVESEGTHRLYRGQAMVSGPQGSGDMVFATPNGEVHFDGGVFTLQYQTQTRTTSVASFGRTVEFKNKFNTAATEKVNAGEISRLTIHDIRVVPSQPIAMSPSSVKEAIRGFELVDSEQEEMVAIVARVFESRAKSLVSELESFRDMKEESESDRAPASLKRYQPAVDEKEEEFTMKILRRRLYQDDESVQNKVEGQKEQSRTPASEAGAGSGVRSIQDREKKKIDQKKSTESVRIMKEISVLDTTESE